MRWCLNDERPAGGLEAISQNQAAALCGSTLRVEIHDAERRATLARPPATSQTDRHGLN